LAKWGLDEIHDPFSLTNELIKILDLKKGQGREIKQ
jgi:hypothetical protein